MENDGRHLTRKEASKFLMSKGFQIRESTLAMFATKGGGPEYYKFGNRAMYVQTELMKWVKERLIRPN